MIATLYDKFKSWADKGSVYILSDTHFADEDCRIMNKNWILPEEQVRIINSTVHKNDTFICLGDVGDPEYARKLRAGYKVLVMGNHDRRSDYRDIFDEIYEGPLFISDKLLLSHEPIYGLEWCFNIHGHDHSGFCPDEEVARHLNLAANVCGYVPVSLGKLINSGILAGIDSMHRMTIDSAIEKKKIR